MNIEDKKKGSATYFLIGSFIFLLLISVGAFIFLGFYMNSVSKESIDKLGSLYMSGMDEQISSHFRTLINLKLEQAEALMEAVSADMNDTDELYQELIYRANIRNFNYLALCSEDGDIELLSGETVQVADPDPFFESLRNNEKKVAVGSSSSGNQEILFGIAAEYPMESGETSMALLVAVPVEYIRAMLSSEGEGSLMNTHIIRVDGSFIVSNMEAEYTDYFSSLYERYPNEDPQKIDTYVKELSSAMERQENYSGILEFGGSRQQVYCTSMPYSEWHLVTILPLGILNETVEDLNQHRTNSTILVCVVIFVVLLIIFFVYYKMTCQQIKDLENAREKALQATQAKSLFLSNMSHDIRTPMNAIVGMTAIAITHIDDKEQVQNCLKKITLSSKHLLGLINDVLDMSKIESGKMTLTAERISLREVIEGVVGIVQTQVKGKGQNLNVHIENIITEDVYCDSVRLNQVLLNLLSNAVKYTQEGGTIQLSLLQENAPLEKGDTYIRNHIIVRDNGIGMTAEFLEHVFDSYSRADSKRVHKIEGAGLGMAITKHIVDAMGGSITVESESNKGTEFHVVLDLEKAVEQEIDMVLPAWKMLVVDDDEILCRTAVDSLKSIGIQADWTLSGEKAIKMVMKQHQLQDDYQIVLVDWKLPGMDGILVAKQIRQMIDTDMPIILISAYDWSEFEEEARSAGISGFIAKPLFKSTLFYGLRKYMDIAGTTDEAEISTDMDLSGCHILVAEDNDLNWEVLKELLSYIGMELEWAENGQICLQKFQESESGYFDAILMDIRMPVMNGYEATKAIRALERPDAQAIPIIAMTADSFSEDVQRCLDSGMNAHTAKPINLDEVVSLLKKYIMKPSP